MNKPYVKQFNEYGEVINPIDGHYLHSEPNRQMRRRDLQKERFYGESKNYHLTVIKQAKFKRVKQIELDNKGKRKIIEHYLEWKYY